MTAVLRPCALFVAALVAGTGYHLGVWPDQDGAPRDEPVALKGLDPVQLAAGKEAKGRAEFAASRDGFRYLFANADSRATFEKDPERYAIQFHGHCAMMTTFRAHPDLFLVHKGRIYGFGSGGCREAFEKEPERYTQPGRGEEKPRSVAILVFAGMELLDFTGPAEVFTAAGYKVNTVAVTRDPVACAGLIDVTPRYTFADCPRTDIVVVPGGNVSAVAKDERVTRWLARASAEAEVTMSVCTGAFVLARAGLLDGKEATTHWSGITRLWAEFPKVTVRENRRVVDNGKVATAAGISAGIDGALHLVDRLSGRAKASETAHNMEYNWPVLAEDRK